MPTDETRRLLKVFGVAVTALEDAVDKDAATQERQKAEAEVRARLQEVTALIERLSVKTKS
jgi:hypothetical protein